MTHAKHNPSGDDPALLGAIVIKGAEGFAVDLSNFQGLVGVLESETADEPGAAVSPESTEGDFVSERPSAGSPDFVLRTTADARSSERAEVDDLDEVLAMQGEASDFIPGSWRDASYDMDVERALRHMRVLEEAKEKHREAAAALEPPLRITRRAERAARPPMTWTVEGLIPEGGSLGVVFGREGSHKTFLALDLALSMANAHKQWMGHTMVAPKSCDAVIVLGEGESDFPSREDAWLASYAGPDGTAEGVVTLEGQAVSLTTDTGLQRLTALLKAEGLNPGIIVFDTQGLTAALGAEENDRTEMRGVYSRAKRLSREFSCLVLLVTHPGNDPKTWSRPAGSSSQLQDVDLALDVRWDNKKKTGKVIVRKVKAGASNRAWAFTPVSSELSLVLRYGGAADSTTAEDDSDLIDLAELDRMVGLVEEAEKKGKMLTTNELHKEFGGGKETFWKIRDDLVEHGQLVVREVGQAKILCLPPVTVKAP